MRGAKFLEVMMKREDKFSLAATSKLLNLTIPFNAPHGFSLVRWTDEEVAVMLPNRKLNHNHIGGIHACAIATLGEFCAGLTIIRALGVGKYRLILAELDVRYHMQGRMALKGVAQLDRARREDLIQRLSGSEKILSEHTTRIEDAQGQHVADVRTMWQLKKWDKVKLR